MSSKNVKVGDKSYAAPLSDATKEWLDGARQSFRKYLETVALKAETLEEVIADLESEIFDGNAYGTQILALDTLPWLRAKRNKAQ